MFVSKESQWENEKVAEKNGGIDNNKIDKKKKKNGKRNKEKKQNEKKLNNFIFCFYVIFIFERFYLYIFNSI